jgi:hypothetical protein
MLDDINSMKVKIITLKPLKWNPKLNSLHLEKYFL